MHHKEQNVQIIGKTRVLVTSTFHANGSTISDRITHLLKREAEENISHSPKG